MAKKVAGWLLLVVGLFLFICPMVYWVKNPELTQMQVLMEYWGEFLGGVVLVFIGTAFVVGAYENERKQNGNDQDHTRAG